MGKNSNVHRNLPYIQADIAREREDDLKRQKLREKREALAAQRQEGSAMDVAGVPGEGKAKRKLKKLGKLIAKKKVVIQTHKQKVNPSAIPIRKSLSGIKKRAKNKPSALMRKTLKKLAKKHEMEMG
ncbi:hypothetical protein Ctob_006551 [Chrysochromulina tobinii]|jgi:hypothetical protein|uniref:Uncharacterized protein n=1 Tax=Chrysochromulina tobinii TaxID=1460289 RepID=A0A0M0JEY9_9EUKA|nr:hypothetical protein Ctob_006551 [Chrysochromulina tobinii]|eukprot:KOO24808.1 hypothetical protein Ctob_006551 [Chrysochromulina sp. CCMP291]